MRNIELDPETGEIITVKKEAIASKLELWPTYVRGLDPERELELRGKLALKLSMAYERIGTVLHDDKNTEHKYSFASAETIYRACRKGMSEVGLAVIPLMGEYIDSPILKKDQSGERRGAYLVLDFDYCLLDAETGYTLVIPWRGEVMEYGDKAFNKAATQATKYMLRTLFLLPTDKEEDGDRDNNEGRPTTRQTKQAPAEPTPQEEVSPEVRRERAAKHIIKSLGLGDDRKGGKEFSELAEKNGFKTYEVFYEIAEKRPSFKTWGEFTEVLAELIAERSKGPGESESSPKPSAKSSTAEASGESSPSEETDLFKSEESAGSSKTSGKGTASVNRIVNALKEAGKYDAFTARAKALKFEIIELIEEALAKNPKASISDVESILSKFEVQHR